MVPSVELQKALVSELSEGSYPVLEIVPADNDAYPLITLSDLNRQTNYTKTNKNRFTYSVRVRGWSIGRSSLVNKEIDDFVFKTVSGLQMEHYDVEFVELVLNANTREEETKDRIVFQSIQEFEITISEKGED